jgi:hypothetical protein
MKIAGEIMSRLPIPEGLSVAAFTGKWNGPLQHVGPERMTPLKEALCFKTNAALYSIYAGTLVWAAARLEGKTDTRQILMLAEALYAWQQDWRWFKRPEKIADLDDMDASDRPTATALYLADLIHQDHIYENRMWSTEPMFATVAEAITLTRYNMPAATLPVFDAWLESLIARLDEVAPFDEQGNTPDLPEGDNPERRVWTGMVMGMPLPPSVLDLSRPVDQAGFHAEWVTLLASLDWERNDYLQRNLFTIVPRSGGTIP